jgi:hypothetical protein
LQTTNSFPVLGDQTDQLSIENIVVIQTDYPIGIADQTVDPLAGITTTGSTKVQRKLVALVRPHSASVRTRFDFAYDEFVADTGAYKRVWVAVGAIGGKPYLLAVTANIGGHQNIVLGVEIEALEDASVVGRGAVS